ncbi:MAG TPA: DUF1592 domain-containing protein, partial [Polyangia bacterium]|nr:DUF1592 domain-containing protein [Polyangia bacterium]
MIGASVLAGCSSGASVGGGGPGGGPGPGMTGGGGPGTTTGGGSGTTQPGVFAPAPGGLRRLTVPQYRNSIADLLGAGALPTTQLEADSALSGFASIGAAQLALSAPITEEFETSALEIARNVLGPAAANRGTFVGCMPAGATDDACATAWLKRFGRRIWRRPLTDVEVGAYSMLIKSVQTTSKDFYTGLQYALAGLLESPNFLYRVELGAPDPANSTQRRFDDYELGTRLAFFIWNTTPDDALLDAADAHQLTTASGWQAQVTRLLASDRAGLAARNFFTEYFRLAELDDLPQLPAVFPQATDTLGPAMREETARFMADVAFAGNADFRTLFDSRDTYVNPELAKLYGLPAVSGADFVKTTLPDSGMRAGYLGQGSFLALNAHANST